MVSFGFSVVLLLGWDNVSTLLSLHQILAENIKIVVDYQS